MHIIFFRMFLLIYLLFSLLFLFSLFFGFKIGFTVDFTVSFTVVFGFTVVFASMLSLVSMLYRFRFFGFYRRLYLFLYHHHHHHHLFLQIIPCHMLWIINFAVISIYLWGVLIIFWFKCINIIIFIFQNIFVFNNQRS